MLDYDDIRAVFEKKQRRRCQRVGIRPERQRRNTHGKHGKYGCGKHRFL